MTAPRDEHAAARAGWASGPWATYGVAPEVWREVADQHAERGQLPTAAQVDLATRCGTAAGQAAVEAFALYHELGELLAAGSPAAERNQAAPGELYLDRDGELVQVLPATAWDPERWGPAEPGLTVCRVLAAAPRYEAAGEVVQRDLRGCLLIRDAAGRVPAALWALAGAATSSGVERFLTGTTDDPADSNAAHRADGLRCGSCGLEHVRLYRDYGCFLRTEDLRCNACLKSTSFMVPCVSAPDGTVWGYTSCPETDIARWYARPDASSAEGAPRWDRGDGEPEGWRVRREPLASAEGGS